MTPTPTSPHVICPRSTRDLRAEVVDLAALLLGSSHRLEVNVVDQHLSAETIHREWDRVMQAFLPELRSRMELAVTAYRNARNHRVHEVARPGFSVDLELVNFPFEVMRQLIEASITQAGPQNVETLVRKIGASQFTVRKVLSEFVRRGLVEQTSPTNARFSVVASDIDLERLGAAKALPQTLRFSYAHGARPRSTADLVRRFEMLTELGTPKEWETIGLSGSAATSVYSFAQVDLLGMPRLDLTAYLGKEVRQLDVTFLEQLDDGLEYQADVRIPAAVVIAVVQSSQEHNHPAGVAPWCTAQDSDIYLAMLDAGLREQAIQFANSGGKGKVLIR
jgi:hypothetical protein